MKDRYEKQNTVTFQKKITLAFEISLLSMKHNFQKQQKMTLFSHRLMLILGNIKGNWQKREQVRFIKLLYEYKLQSSCVFPICLP